MIKGTLIPIGGNEDKGSRQSEIYSLEFIQEGILANVVKESGGINAKIIVVTMASRIPKQIGKGYKRAFRSLGCTNVKVVHIKKTKHALREKTIEAFKTADCVMFSGGDQSRITEKLKGSEIHSILLDRYQNDNFVIAGTSAGAMAMVSEMVAGGSSTEAFVKGAVRMREGLGLIPGIMIDTHFIQRGRFGRVSEAVSKFPDLIGFGLAEDTGMVIKNGNDCTVIGSGMVIVFDGTHLTHNNQDVLKEGTPMTMTNLKVHVLSNGDAYHIKERKVRALPIEASFI